MGSTPKTLELQVGEKYVMRNGEIVEIINMDQNSTIFPAEGLFEGVRLCWTVGGAYAAPNGFEYDLVAPYVPETIPPPAPPATTPPRISMDKTYVSRGGRPVTVLCTDINSLYCVAAIEHSTDGDDWVMQYTAEGTSCLGNITVHDLVEAPKVTRKRVWINLFGEEIGRMVHMSKESAEGYVECTAYLELTLEWREGDLIPCVSSRSC